MTRPRSLSVVYFTPLYYVRGRPQNSELGPVPSHLYVLPSYIIYW